MHRRDTPPSFEAPSFRVSRSLALLFGIALAAISVLPQFLPVKPTYSDSYWFGYNNRVGVVIFLLYLLLVGLFARTGGFVFAAPARNTHLPKRLCLAWMFVFAAGCGLMFL